MSAQLNATQPTTDSTLTHGVPWIYPPRETFPQYRCWQAGASLPSSSSRRLADLFIRVCSVPPTASMPKATLLIPWLPLWDRAAPGRRPPQRHASGRITKNEGTGPHRDPPVTSVTVAAEISQALLEHLLAAAEREVELPQAAELKEPTCFELSL